MTVPLPHSAQPPKDDRNAKLVDDITRSDIGVTTLLTRLKQSVTSTNDCAAFFKKRATQEERNAQEIRKISRSTLESVRRPDSRQGSYAHQFEELARIHDRLAENGLQFAAALHQMHDDLIKLSSSMDHGRKQWKLFGLSSEKKVHDADAAVDKAKARLDALVEGAEGGRPGRLGFLAAAKSGLSRRDDDMTPTEAATEDYQNKQQTARALRQELLQSQRPQAVKALQDMISECDSGLAAHLQKYASLIEKMVLANGETISPLPGAVGAGKPMRDVIAAIDNKEDFQSFMLSYASKMPTPPPPPPQQHPPQAPPPQNPQQGQGQPPAPPSHQQKPPHSHSGPQQFDHAHNPYGQQPIQSPPNSPPYNMLPHGIPPTSHSRNASQFGGEHQRSFSGPGRPDQQYGPEPMGQPPYGGPPHHTFQPDHHRQVSQPLSTVSSMTARAPVEPQHTPPTPAKVAQSPPPDAPPPQELQSPKIPQQQQPEPTTASQELPGVEPRPRSHGFGSVVHQPAVLPSGPPQPPRHARQESAQPSFPDLPRLRPVFGVSLEYLLRRDESAVPIIVYSCIQAVELYGISNEGIYRVSGEKRHVERLKAIVDNDASKLDFTRPEDFFHDVNSVASILKQFFRELPEPLVTHALYTEFLNAARIPEDVVRRDTLHGLINQLPDPNYATLRILIIHLHRVQEHSDVNRMNAHNLAVSFGPTLFGDNSNDMKHAGWAVAAAETIILNCYSIFEA
ncbi:RhoGAP-domain-containing protein [Ascodesmis nigricans]|uniref:RhoGAP-domain-containing protein n=1 Tax=Ascodesmis nigricans TaxID=341454 RepID=A0A4S2N8G3_9PEZI|nr:RhoGAP-domain-containing protein [Ascodesmis nigricans]